jgi:hypothetical protein
MDRAEGDKWDVKNQSGRTEDWGTLQLVASTWLRSFKSFHNSPIHICPEDDKCNV